MRWLRVPRRLVIDVNNRYATSRGVPGDDLPAAFCVRVGHSDLGAVRREPSSVVLVHVAITSAASSAAQDFAPALKFAHDCDRPGIVTRHIGEISAIGGRHNVVVERPDVRGYWP